MEFVHDILVEGIEEFGKHGLLFLLLFGVGFRISIGLLLVIGVLLK